jgi:hypothetical protein
MKQKVAAVTRPERESGRIMTENRLKKPQDRKSVV